VKITITDISNLIVDINNAIFLISRIQLLILIYLIVDIKKWHCWYQ